MKLYEIPMNSMLVMQNRTTGTKDFELLFHRIDGIFSICSDSAGRRVYLSASTNLQLQEDGLYRIVDAEIQVAPFSDPPVGAVPRCNECRQVLPHHKMDCTRRQKAR